MYGNGNKPGIMNSVRFIVAAGCLTALCLAEVPAARADVKLPAIFSSHMVLQQKIPNRVWGWADPGEEVTVSISSQSHKATAGSDGAWSVTLQPLSVGEPLTLTVKGKNTVTIEDVLVGEVWICSGQSNMQWSVRVSNNADLEKAAARYPQIRLISVPQVGTQEPQKDFRGSWQVCSPESVENFSAVGYFFGRQLHQTLGVPVGLINNAWGGSACEAWIRRDLLSKDPQYAELMASWAQREEQLSSPAAAADFAAKLKVWEEAAAKAKAEGKPAPGGRPQPPQALLGGNHRPANIYNGVLKPTIGYGIKGAIWYQGESNAGRAYQYRNLFPLMIKSWRDEWAIGDFPFYYVQLADFLAEQKDPVESAWAELREAQTMTMSKLPNVGQAVIIDLGEGQDIHPRNKQDVAARLARWALAKDYGLNVPYRSPEYESMKAEGNKIVLTFANVGEGLRAFDFPVVKGFAIAGEDKKWVWATAKITGPKTIEVSAEGVAAPVAVRYGWADNPVCNVYSREGLPLTPFRTDDWEGITAKNLK